MSNPPLIALVGPTAAGKSSVALHLARQLSAEIVNADAFCLYRGMDIGTAKPRPEEQAEIPHHVLDTHDVEQDVDVAQYQQAARAAIVDITNRGRPALLVGGSGLYVQAVLEDLRFPGTDPEVRARLETELAELGAEVLHARLSAIDPVAAVAILPGNGRRIVRALEVNEITGQPFEAALGPQQPWRPSVRIGVDPGVEAVDTAIAGRVEEMWRAGFLDEVQELAPRMGRTACRAVGYRQVIEDPASAKPATIVATRQLARRQRKWFRRDPSVRWAESASQVEQILGRLGV